MKLKQISQEVIREIYLQRGHADYGTTSLDMYETIADQWTPFGRVSKFNNPNGGLLDARVRGFIKKSAVDSQGLLYICVYKRYDLIYHVLFKIDEPWQRCVVGIMHVEKTQGAYSIANVFDIDIPQVHWSNIAEEYRGMKYGAFLYDTLLYMYGGLRSDTILYEGSLNMWVHHMSSTGRLTAAVIASDSSRNSMARGQKVIVPMTAKDLKDATYLERINSIVVFYNVPARMQTINKFTNNLSPRDGSLGIIWYDGKIEASGVFTTYDTTAGFDQENEDKNLTMADFLDQYSYSDLITMTTQGEVTLGRAAHISIDGYGTLETDDVHQLNKSRKIIMSAKDAIILIEPYGDDDIKYTIL